MKKKNVTREKKINIVKNNRFVLQNPRDVRSGVEGGVGGWGMPFKRRNVIKHSVRQRFVAELSPRRVPRAGKIAGRSPDLPLYFKNLLKHHLFIYLRRGRTTIKPGSIISTTKCANASLPSATATCGWKGTSEVRR